MIAETLQKFINQEPPLIYVYSDSSKPFEQARFVLLRRAQLARNLSQLSDGRPILEQAILKSIVASAPSTRSSARRTSRRRRSEWRKRLESLVAADRHITARGPHPGTRTASASPTSSCRGRRNAWDEYAPDEYTHPSLVENDRSKKEGGWADPPDPKAIGRGDCVDAEDGRARAWMGRRPVARVGARQAARPLPGDGRAAQRGRTGLSGRGLLGKWGPNHAADPIVTRWREGERVLEMVAVQRADAGEWAIPGGMVEAERVVSAQVKKEFEEECFAGDSKEHGEENRKRLEWIFHRGVEVYRGYYVDDPYAAPQPTSRPCFEPRLSACQRRGSGATPRPRGWRRRRCISRISSLGGLADALKLGSGDPADVKRVTWLAMDPIHETQVRGALRVAPRLTDRVRKALIGHKQSGGRTSSARRPLFVKEAQRVRESQVSWLVEKSDYAPVFFNDPDTVVTSDGDPVKGADAPDDSGTLLEELKHKRQTYEGDVEFIELHPSRPDQTAPRNPRGRTGIAGRGTLYKWGPNHAVVLDRKPVHRRRRACCSSRRCGANGREVGDPGPPVRGRPRQT